MVWFDVVVVGSAVVGVSVVVAVAVGACRVSRNDFDPFCDRSSLYFDVLALLWPSDAMSVVDDVAPLE